MKSKTKRSTDTVGVTAPATAIRKTGASGKPKRIASAKRAAVPAAHRKRITIIIAIIAAVFSAVSFVLYLARVTNMHIVFFLVLGFSALLITYLILWTLRASEKHKRAATILHRLYMVCLLTGVAVFFTLQGFIISGARTESADVDCIIILGAGLRNDVPSLVLRRRLNKAVEYVSANGDIPIIVSGGLGRGETVTEAEAMRRYLVGRGVDDSMIWKEEASTSTKENITFSMDVIKDKGLDADNIKIAIISNEFHLFRAKLIADKAGLDAIGVAAETPGVYLRVIYFCREAFALAAEIIRV